MHLHTGHVGIVIEDGRAEVDELEDATLRVDDADVGRLDVAVRDAEAGEEGERVEHLDGEGPDRARVPVPEEERRLSSSGLIRAHQVSSGCIRVHQGAY